MDRETHEMMDKVVINADTPSLSYKPNNLALPLIFQCSKFFLYNMYMREMDRTFRHMDRANDFQ